MLGHCIMKKTIIPGYSVRIGYDIVNRTWSDKVYCLRSHYLRYPMRTQQVSEFEK